MNITYEDIQKVNETIKTIPIKGKEYAQVPERIKAFRMLYPEGSIKTSVISLDGGVVVMNAEVRTDDGRLLGTGTAYEKEGSSFINSTSFIENCETSCIGRALVACGIGIDVSVSSAEELANALLNQDKKKYDKKGPDEPVKYVPGGERCEDCDNIITDKKQSNGEIKTAQEIIEFSEANYGRRLCSKCLNKVMKGEG